MNNYIKLCGAIAYEPKAYDTKNGGKGYALTLAVDSDTSTRRYYVSCFVSLPCSFDVANLKMLDNLIVEGVASANAYIGKDGLAHGNLSVNVDKITLVK